jgi:hypothetical protein
MFELENILLTHEFYMIFFQSAQRRLRAMIQSALMTAPVNGNGPMRVSLGPAGDSSI